MQLALVMLQFMQYKTNDTLAADWSNCARAETPNTCLLLRFLNESLAKVPRRDLRLGLERAFWSGYTDLTPEALSPRALECNNTAHQTPRHVSHKRKNRGHKAVTSLHCAQIKSKPVLRTGFCAQHNFSSHTT